jgi:hypothetical protein
MMGDRLGVLEAALPKQGELIARGGPTLSAGLQMTLPILRKCRHDVHGFNPQCDSRRPTMSASLPAKKNKQRLNPDDHGRRSFAGVFCCGARPATMISIKIARMPARVFLDEARRLRPISHPRCRSKVTKR